MALAATSARQAQLYVNMDSPNILAEKWSQKSIETWNIRCIGASVIMRFSNEKYELG